ncbi:MAG: CYTH domain-containing protein [Bacillota bacterium]|nr:CYTH domain-containing protein [Bacillota bacterium]
MEIELKYTIPDEETAKALWDNELFGLYEEKDTREEINLHAKYYDTADLDLARNDIAYRVRLENNDPVATIKWKGHSEDGLHVREEINVPADSDEPNPELFQESRMGAKLMEVIADKELKCIMETKIHRQQFRIDTGEGIYEFSVDEGEVVTECGSQPIREVEIELYSGETEEMVKIGEKLQNKYGLTSENKSKYAKGLEMIKGCE